MTYIRLLIIAIRTAIILAISVQAGYAAPTTIRSSLLLLIDVSGSMGDEIGNGNSEVKIEAAKKAATAAVRHATQKGSVEVAVLAFEGDCAQPVSRYAGFTTDGAALTGFIDSLRPGGGTPMAEAVLFANRYMKTARAPSTQDQMIVLLADGQNDCGNVAAALAELKASGVIFRHETVGFGIKPNSGAAQDLRTIATTSGGTYHHAADATQLGDLFVKFVNTFTLIDMLGSFGHSGTPGTAAKRPGQPKKKPAPGVAPAPSTSASGQVTGMLGLFKPKPPRPAAKVDDPPPDGPVLCYKKFSNPLGLPGIRDNHAVSEFSCAPVCEPSTWMGFLVGGATLDQTCMSFQNLDPRTMSCAAQCAYASRSGAPCVGSSSTGGNYCVGAFDELQPPGAVTHYYCDYSDNKHRLTWQGRPQPTAGFRIYLNHFPDRNDNAEFMGETARNTFDFEYGINFHEEPGVDGMNIWNPFPQAGVSACNKYGICTPVVYGELVADCEP